MSAWLRPAVIFGFGSWLLGCGAPDPSTSQDAPVVGGRTESGYPAVGYLMNGADRSSLRGPNCGATVIAPSVAVTAAHCIVMAQAPVFGIGLGTVGSGPPYPARRVVVHPSYAPNGPSRYQHDVAVLLLETPVPVTPAVIARADPQRDARYVGYGRVTPGPVGERNGYTGERKSARQTIMSIDGLNVFTTGADGGLCWGDSGGPLFQNGTNELLGVLADFDGDFNCYSGNRMIFTSLAGESAFIESAMACPDGFGSECMQEPPSCQYACADHGYGPGQCWAGWYCDDGCLVQKECPMPDCEYTCADYGYADGQCYQGWVCHGTCLVPGACN